MTTKKKVVKKPVKRVKKALTLRQVLNVIEKVLIKEDNVAGQLWNVLTALRGPDAGAYADKHKHTIPIRRAAFPKIAAGVDKGRLMGPADFIAADYSRPEDSYEHFGRHVVYAAEALGLE